MDAKSAIQTAWQYFGAPLIQPFRHKPKWVYAFTVIVVALFAVDIVLIKGNADPFFILPFYLLPLLLVAPLAVLAQQGSGIPFTITIGIMMCVVISIDLILLDKGYIYASEFEMNYVGNASFIVFWYWGYANGYKLFRGKFPFSIIFMIPVYFFITGFPEQEAFSVYSDLFQLLFYLAGFLCAPLLILLDKCFHVLNRDRKLRTILLTMFCCYLGFSGDEWLGFYRRQSLCFAQVNPASVVAPTLKGKTLSMERQKQKDGNLDIFTDTYRDDATGKLYLTQKIYARTDSAASGWYGRSIYQAAQNDHSYRSRHIYKQAQPQFGSSNSMTCPRPLYEFSKKYDFRIARPKGEM